MDQNRALVVGDGDEHDVREFGGLLDQSFKAHALAEHATDTGARAGLDGLDQRRALLAQDLRHITLFAVDIHPRENRDHDRENARRPYDQPGRGVGAKASFCKRCELHEISRPVACTKFVRMFEKYTGLRRGIV
jgi:hypothetical protein